jgi:L-ascorbate metabolism protein UlaG (beta-lactamase superfamily)
MLEDVQWLGHASFRIVSDLVIYIDPWKIKSEDIKADIIFITHPHSDHLSIPDIEAISRHDTLLIAPPDCTNILQGRVDCELINISPGDEMELEGVRVKAIPAYNRKSDHHPKAKNWVGYVIEILGEKLYFAGDTDHIHEMRHLDDITIAFLPVGGTYTMNVEQAVDAALDIQPKYLVPMHYGDLAGTMANPDTLKSILEDKDPSIEVVIKQPEEI